MLDTHILDIRDNIPFENGRQKTQLKLLPSSSSYLKLTGVCKNKVNYRKYLLSSTQIL